jgi:hypothetical protein
LCTNTRIVWFWFVRLASHRSSKVVEKSSRSTEQEDSILERLGKNLQVEKLDSSNRCLSYRRDDALIALDAQSAREIAWRKESIDLRKIFRLEESVDIAKRVGATHFRARPLRGRKSSFSSQLCVQSSRGKPPTTEANERLALPAVPEPRGCGRRDSRLGRVPEADERATRTTTTSRAKNS